MTSNTERLPYTQAVVDLLEDIIDRSTKIENLLKGTSLLGTSRIYKYVAKRVKNPTNVKPNGRFDVFQSQNGILKGIWIEIDSDAFEFVLNINGEDFSTDLPELVTYVGQNVVVDNDWTLTYVNAAPAGPPAALRFQSIEGLPYNNITFYLRNTDPNNSHNILRYRYFYIEITTP